MRKNANILLSGMFIVAWLLFSVNPNAAYAAEEKKGDNIFFRWAFGAIVGGEDNRKLVRISHDRVVKKGDRFKFKLTLKKKCFVYLIYYDGLGEIQLLFPRYFAQFTDDYNILKTHLIPQGDLWFALNDNGGQKTIYLLASARRLTGLETLLAENQSAEAVRQPELADKVIMKINRLNRVRNKFLASAERPVPIGGTLRGKVPFFDLDAIAVDISATDFYSRIIHLDPR